MKFCAAFAPENGVVWKRHCIVPVVVSVPIVGCSAVGRLWYQKYCWFAAVKVRVPIALMSVSVHAQGTGAVTTGFPILKMNTPLVSGGALFPLE